MEETKNTRNTYIAKNGKNQEEKNNIMIMEKKTKTPEIDTSQKITKTKKEKKRSQDIGKA